MANTLILLTKFEIKFIHFHKFQIVFLLSANLKFYTFIRSSINAAVVDLDSAELACIIRMLSATF